MPLPSSRDLRRRIDALGGYFALHELAGPPDPPGLPGPPGRPDPPGPPGWRPLAALVADPAELARRSARLRERWAERSGRPVDDVDGRACASALHLGLAARLLSPPFAAASLAGAVLRLDPDRWWWREPRPGEPSIGLAVDGPAVDRLTDEASAVEASVVEASTERPADAFTAGVLAPVLLPLEDAVRAGCGVSRQVLRGNLASALVGTATAFVAAVGEGRGGSEGPADRARSLVAGLVARPELAGAGGFVASGTFRRRSCCLFYRLPGGGLCGDCVLSGSPGRRTPPGRG